MLMLTVGHSTRAAEEFLSLLAANDVSTVVDVRRFPASRRHPHFAAEPLEGGLRARGIGYVHAEALGGRRSPAADSPNSALRSDAFRGYADHMRTPLFQAALTDLIARAQRERPAIMCAEAVPWRCHRWILSDQLLARDVRVEHIIGSANRTEHVLSAEARVENGFVTYRGADALF